MPLFVGVTDDRHDRHYYRDVGRWPPRFCCALGNVGYHVAGEVSGLTKGMDMNAVRHFACHPQHPRIHRGDVDFGVGRVDGSGAPLRGDEVEVIELAVMIELPRSECGEARFHG